MAKNTRLPLLRLSSRALSLLPSSVSMSAHGIVNLPVTIVILGVVWVKRGRGRFGNGSNEVSR